MVRLGIQTGESEGQELALGSGEKGTQPVVSSSLWAGGQATEDRLVDFPLGSALTQQASDYDLSSTEEPSLVVEPGFEPRPESQARLYCFLALKLSLSSLPSSPIAVFWGALSYFCYTASLTSLPCPSTQHTTFRSHFWKDPQSSNHFS